MELTDLSEAAKKCGRKLSILVDGSTGAAWYELWGDDSVIEFYRLSELVKWLEEPVEVLDTAD